MADEMAALKAENLVVAKVDPKVVAMVYWMAGNLDDVMADKSGFERVVKTAALLDDLMAEKKADL